jgi:uncharacterized protein with HEPN domain
LSTERAEVFLEHILESIDLILGYTSGMSLEEFTSSREKQDAVVRRLEIIGEAVKNLPLALRASYPQVPWRQIAGTRDRLIHHYFAVDVDLTWQIVEGELVTLRREVTIILADLNRPPAPQSKT